LPSDDHDRAERFRQGEPDEISAVSKLIRLMVGEKGYYIPLGEREDVVQEVLIHVHRAVSAPGFVLERRFEGLVRMVAHRRCVDWMRRHGSIETVHADTPSPDADPEASLLSREKVERGTRVLRALGAACRELIRLRVGEGLRYREIASRLDRTEQSVRSHMYKCLKRARQLLQQASQTGDTSPPVGER
jgi:RNA polymerase sigma factor (sigma-70 family)